MQGFLLLVVVCSLASLSWGRSIVGEPSQNADDDQYAFLTELYNMTSGEMWANNTNWLVKNDSITLCNWHGITCAGKWVEKIDLHSNGLGGELPNQWERIPYLDSLDLSSNKILGTLPPSIGNLSLERLILDGNALRGTVPSTLGHLNARLIYLSNNHFTGTLPSSIADNPLEGLTLDNNHFTGSLPSHLADRAGSLMVVSGAFNDFSGMFPSGLCGANACNFQYNPHLGCPSQSCKCALQLCNCGIVCTTSADCTGGSCPSCSRTSWGYTTCGGK